MPPPKGASAGGQDGASGVASGQAGREANGGSNWHGAAEADRLRAHLERKEEAMQVGDNNICSIVVS